MTMKQLGELLKGGCGSIPTANETDKQNKMGVLAAIGEYNRNHHADRPDYAKKQYRKVWYKKNKAKGDKHNER